MTAEELEAKGYKLFNDYYCLNFNTGEIYISQYLPGILDDDIYTYYSLDGVEFFPYNGPYSCLEVKTKKNVEYTIKDLNRRISKKKDEIEILDKLVDQLEKYEK